MENVMVIALIAVFAVVAVAGVLIDNGYFVSDKKKGDKKDAQ